MQFISLVAGSASVITDAQLRELNARFGALTAKACTVVESVFQRFPDVFGKFDRLLGATFTRATLFSSQSLFFVSTDMRKIYFIFYS